MERSVNLKILVNFGILFLLSPQKTFLPKRGRLGRRGLGGGMPSRPSEVRKAPPPARLEQNTKEKFCFLVRRKKRAHANKKMRTNLFFGVASVSERRGGGSVSFKMGSC